MNRLFFFTLLSLSKCLQPYAQHVERMQDKLIHFPLGFLNKTEQRMSLLNDRLMRQTERYLHRLERQEQKIQRRMMKVDSLKCKQLFDGSEEKYRLLRSRLAKDSGQLANAGGEYLPYADSLKGALDFLNKHTSLLGRTSGAEKQLQSAVGELRLLQSRLHETDQIKAFIQQRRMTFQQVLSQYNYLPPSLTRYYEGFTKEAYYYSEQVRSYKEMFNNPDELAKKVLFLLNKLPAFHQFMQEHSQLAGLFRVPASYASGNLGGLQTRDQVQQLIQQRVASGGQGGLQTLQQNLQAAQAQLNHFKDKLQQLGQGSGDIEIPEFKPNQQRTKTFLRRLEYGTNLQTVRSDYFFPTTTDLGLSVGYRLNNKSIAGIGASYKLGWGRDIHHIAITNQGIGLRSFVEMKIKGSFYANGGFEYNYQRPFASVLHLPEWSGWQQSGLLGISKVISLKSKMFKKTKVQLLWDFLSYRQRPQTRPILFRIGYSFN